MEKYYLKIKTSSNVGFNITKSNSRIKSKLFFYYTHDTIPLFPLSAHTPSTRLLHHNPRDQSQFARLSIVWSLSSKFTFACYQPNRFETVEMKGEKITARNIMAHRKEWQFVWYVKYLRGREMLVSEQTQGNCEKIYIYEGRTFNIEHNVFWT